ncbi:MAG: hypothetical protein LBQ60_11725 [Bacteroidales bacterium]|jgi:hypothetical protein|nr:hypothetical protein [Bacteroidales bacterium]
MKKYVGNIAGIVILGALTVAFVIHALGGSRTGKWDIPWFFAVLTTFGCIMHLVQLINKIRGR